MKRDISMSLVLVVATPQVSLQIYACLQKHLHNRCSEVSMSFLELNLRHVFDFKPVQFSEKWLGTSTYA